MHGIDWKETLTNFWSLTVEAQVGCTSGERWGGRHKEREQSQFKHQQGAQAKVGGGGGATGATSTHTIHTLNSEPVRARCRR